VANRQSGGKDVCYRGIFRNFVVWAEPDKKSIFSYFYGTLRLSCAQPTGNSFTSNQWYWWKAETLKVCLLLVWRVCDQAFGRYRPWRVPKSGHVISTKIESLHIGIRRKIHLFQKCYSIRSTTKNNEVIAEKPLPNSGVTRGLWMLGRLELTLVVNTCFWLVLSFTVMWLVEVKT